MCDYFIIDRVPKFIVLRPYAAGSQENFFFQYPRSTPKLPKYIYFFAL